MTFSHGFSEHWFGGRLTVTPSVPTETGGIVDQPVPSTITLDGYTFTVDMKEWRSGPQDTFRDNISQTDEPNDTLFNARGAWSRYRYSWHQGSGQTLADLDEDALNFRFESSYGVDWSTEYGLSLIQGVTQSKTAAGSNLLLCLTCDYTFLADGTALYRTADFVSWTTMTAPGGTIQALSTDGVDLYVATTTVAVKYVGAATTSTAFATPVTGDCTNIAFCANRLLLAKGHILYEVAGTGALTTIRTHFQSAFRWKAMFNIGSRIYVGGVAGCRSELYSLTTDSAGALVQSQEAASFPPGEHLRTAVSSAGVVMICTSKGVRVADVTGDGTLTYGPLLSGPGEVQAAVIDAQYGYVGWADMGGGRCGLGRLVLDEDLQALQPAYGTDVYQTAAQAAVTGVVRMDDITAFAVQGAGVWATTANTFATEGEVQSGKLTFGTVEPKALIGMTVRFEPLKPDEAITATISDENGVNIGSGTISTDGATSLEIDLGGEQVRYCKVRLLLSGNGTTTPTVQHWRLRAYPIPPPVMQWVLPLVAHERVVVGLGEGHMQSLDLDEVHTWIEGLWGERRYTYFRHGRRSYRVRVDNFEWRPRKWTDQGENPQGLLIVQLVDA